jgi:hypothetical protein
MQIEDGIYNALCNMQTFANDDDKQISATSLQASATKLESATSIKTGSKTELETKKAGDEDSDEEIAKREGLPEVKFGQIFGKSGRKDCSIFGRECFLSDSASSNLRILSFDVLNSINLAISSNLDRRNKTSSKQFEER